MTVHHHVLRGCAPEPLAHYLKALAVLRLTAEQADREARGWWASDVFHVLTRLDETALLSFFLHDYVPSGIVSGWNGGSGFYPKDKDKQKAVAAIERGTAPRFARCRRMIDRTRAIFGGRAESPKEDEKAALLRRCRAEWAEESLDWLDAALVILADAKLDYPGLLGTGGNDGRLEFTGTFLARLSELFDPASGNPRPQAEPLLSGALFGTTVSGLVLGRAVGQFLPGGAGGANSVAGYQGESLVNPWDFVLALEGTLILRVAAVRRLDGSGLARAAAPFAVRSQAGGYGSASAADEGARGEQWLPLWGQPASLAEVQAIFREARLQIGRRRARGAVDAARAIARVGVARGLCAFTRFGFIVRNGRANLAVPLGRWTVTNNPELRLLDEVAEWVDRLRRAARQKTAPMSLGAEVRRIEAVMLRVCRPGAGGASWEAMLTALAAAEDRLAARRRSTGKQRLRPLPRLSVGWLKAVDDGSQEVRLAAAVSSQDGGRHVALGPIRAHCLPLDPESGWRRFRRSGDDTLVDDPRVVWRGRDVASDLAAVAARRLLEGEADAGRGFALQGRAFAPLADVEAFLEGSVDDARIANLARGLMALGWEGFRRGGFSWRAAEGRSGTPSELGALHALFRLVHLPEPLGDLVPRSDREVLRLLVAGRLADAAAVALRRLGASGLRPKVRLALGSPALSCRLAAALAVPVDPRDLGRLRDLVAKPLAETFARSAMEG